MKKLFLICLLVGGISSFTNAKNINSNKDSLSTIGLCCTATVMYNGQPVASFTECGAYACDLAQASACVYIEANGGTCPQHQQ